MRFSNLYKVSIILVVLFTQSCNKYLDVEPDNRTTINSVEKVAQVLAFAYPTRDYYSFTEAASDNSEDRGNDNGAAADVYTMPYFWQDDLGTSLGSVTNYWNYTYKAIAAANQALEAIRTQQLGDAVLPYKGEALVARAYAHFMLVTFFAKPYVVGGANESPGIPYVTEPETQVIKQYDRETVQATYQKIEKDLVEGLSLLSNEAYKAPKFHFTPAAAHAFAARFYLFKGEWQRVVEHATAVTIDFLGDLRPINTTYKNLATADFRVLFTKAEVKSNLLLTTSYSLYQYYTNSDYQTSTYKIRYGFGDKLNKMFSATGNYTGKPLANKVAGTTPNYNLNKYNPFFYKPDPNKNSGYTELTSPLFVTDEALMNRAEAYAQLGQLDKALDDVATFLSVRITNYNAATDRPTVDKAKAFYNIADDKEAVIALILASKKAEFLQEGIRWFDILRHRLPVKHNVFTPTGSESFIELKADDLRKVFQIPAQSVLAGVPLNPR